MSANLFPSKKLTPQQVGLLSAAVPSPFGDALGLLADGVGYAQDPKSFTLGKGLLSLAALVPGIPSTRHGVSTFLHGSPFKFSVPDVAKAGSNTDFGYLGKGLYGTIDADHAKWYADSPWKVTGKQGKFIYEFDVPSELGKKFLSADLPLIKQSDEIKEAIRGAGIHDPYAIGEQLYKNLRDGAYDVPEITGNMAERTSAATEFLKKLGILGISGPKETVVYSPEVVKGFRLRE